MRGRFGGRHFNFSTWADTESSWISFDVASFDVAFLAFLVNEFWNTDDLFMAVSVGRNAAE
jgi:hypothetical protein